MPHCSSLNASLSCTQGKVQQQNSGMTLDKDGTQMNKVRVAVSKIGNGNKSDVHSRANTGFFSWLCLVLLASVCLAPQCLGQASSTTGTVRGVVTDSQGAVVPNASVVVTNPATGTVRSVTSNADGSFQVPQLNPGTYRIDVNVTGFDKLTAKDVVLTVGQTVTYDAHLTVGGSNTVVEVSTAALLIDQTQTQQANTIDQRQQVNLPNLSRNFAQQLFTLPGVVDSNAPSIQDPNVGTGYQSSGASFGGGNGRGNLFTIDGGQNDYGSGAPREAHVPQDSVQEFQVNRNSFNAEFGFTTGSAINVITKSGTNQYHGSAFGYFHNESTDAVNYFNSFGPTAGQRPFEQSAIFGGSVGGFLKKDKLFFFASYERQKLDSNITTNLLGTAAAIGIAAQTNGFNGKTCPAPVTQACYLAQATAQGGALGAVAQGLIASGALSPTLNPQFVNLVAPDSGTFDGNALGAVQSAPGADGRYNNFVSRLDYTPNEKNTYSLRLSYSHEQNEVIGAGGVPRFTSVIQQLRDQTFTANWNHIFNPNLVNTVRVQVVPHNSVTNNTPRGGAEFDLGSLGTVGTIFDIPYNQAQNQYQFDDDLALTKGNHNFKFGGSFRPVQFNIFQAFLFNGDYQFQDSDVPLIALVPAMYQGAFVNFNVQNYGLNQALGPTSTNLSGPQEYNIGQPIVLEQAAGNGNYQATEKPLGFYAQDSWKVTHNLTLNYGGRFDFDPTPNNYATTFFGSPRVGLAYDPYGNGKTVIRAGGGLFTAPVLFIVPFTSTVLDGTSNHIFATVRTAADSAAQLGGALAIEKSMATAANPNPAVSTAQLATVGIGVIPTGPTKLGGAFFTVDPNFKQQYSIQGSASVAQELAPNLSFELGYVYYAGVHIQQIQEANFVPSGIVDPFIGPLYQPRPGTTQGEPNNTIVQNDETTSAGHSTYNALTASLTKKYGHGLQFQANYTWSKAIDNTSDFSSQSTPFRPGFLNLDRGISDFNIKNSFVANAVYTSPTHHGGDSFARNLYSDFVVAPIVQVRDGVPFTLLFPGLGGSNSNGTPGNAATATPAQNGNSSHVSEARPFHEGRNLGIGPAYATFDMRISRAIALKRDSPLRLNLIAQSSNVLNHTNFTSVQNIITNPSVTQGANGLTNSAIQSTPEGNIDLLNGPYNFKGFRPVGATQLSTPLAFKTAAPPRQISFGLELAF